MQFEKDACKKLPIATRTRARAVQYKTAYILMVTHCRATRCILHAFSRPLGVSRSAPPRSSSSGPGTSQRPAPLRQHGSCACAAACAARSPTCPASRAARTWLAGDLDQRSGTSSSGRHTAPGPRHAPLLRQDRCAKGPPGALPPWPSHPLRTRRHCQLGHRQREMPSAMTSRSCCHSGFGDLAPPAHR